MRFPEFEGEWGEYKLRDVIQMFSGGTPPMQFPDYWNGNIPLISAISMHNTYISSSTQYITNIGLEKGSKLLQKENLLLLVRGSMLWNRIPICYNLIDVAFNQDVKGIVVNNKSTSLFVLYWFQSKETFLKSLVTGTGIGAGKLDSETIFSLQIALPNKIEQSKIAKILSLLDQRIATQNKIIEELKLLKSTLSKRLLLNESWKQFQIAEIASLGRGRVISSIEISKQRNPKYPVYSSQTSNNGIMGYLDVYDFDGEYVTWTTDGANAGTVFYRDGKFNCTNVCGTLKISKNHNPYFVALCLNLITKKYVSTNLANPKLMNNVMASIKVYIPELQEQNRLAKLFVSLTNKIQCEISILEALCEKKNYFLQQMFI